MSEHRILKEIKEARKSEKAMDDLIYRYEPFIKSEVSSFINHIPVYGTDDEFSIALMAFYEAVKSYSQEKGAFFSFASVVIRNRLIDYARKEKRHLCYLSLEEELEAGGSLHNKAADISEHSEEYAMRDATKSEIEELTANLRAFGVNLTDVSDNCPRQNKTLEACRKALEFAMSDKKVFDDFLRTKRLPVKRIAKGSGVDRKTLERHRKYLVAIFLIQTNGYEIIRGHIKCVLNGGVQK